MKSNGTCTGQELGQLPGNGTKTYRALRLILGIALAGAGATWFATSSFAAKSHEHSAITRGGAQREELVRRLDRVETKLDHLIEIIMLEGTP